MILKTSSMVRLLHLTSQLPMMRDALGVEPVKFIASKDLNPRVASLLGESLDIGHKMV